MGWIVTVGHVETSDVVTDIKFKNTATHPRNLYTPLTDQVEASATQTDTLYSASRNQPIVPAPEVVQEIKPRCHFLKILITSTHF